MAIEEFRGDDFDLTVEVYDSNTESGMANLTGCTLLLDVKPNIDQSGDANETTALIQKTQACTTAPTTGKQMIHFDPEDTEDLDAEINYTLGVKLIDADLKPHTIIADQLYLRSELVRRTT
jgi:hypothetical protein